MTTTAQYYEGTYPTDPFNGVIKEHLDTLGHRQTNHVYNVENTLANMQAVLDTIQCFENKIDSVGTVVDQMESYVTLNEVPEVCKVQVKRRFTVGV